MRSTGIVALSDASMNYALLTTNPKKHNDEVFLRYNAAQIIEWMSDHNPTDITIEGLSHNAKSGSKDLIAANYWFVRMEIARVFPDAALHIVPVTMWRAPLFSKEENKTFTANKKLMAALKAELKLVKDKKVKAAMVVENEQLILDANIKWLTWMKLPTNLRELFLEYGFLHGTFDITDAYFIANYTYMQQQGASNV